MPVDRFGAMQPQPDLGILMAGAQSGDKIAYARLLGLITPYLRGLARRTFRNPDEAEDAVQDILLTVHIIRDTYDPTRPFRPWLVAVARRRIIDRLRKTSRRAGREIPLDLDHHHAIAAEADGPPEFDADPKALHRAIQALPPGQRQAVELLRLKEMSLKEASAASGQSVGALKVAMHRAGKSLRALLAGAGKASADKVGADKVGE